ncbi:MAG: hypothetical protein M3Y74_03115 [Chloroflexota bacterium]|nr:hypothetical protein [Chloroflexota bacterium]
MDTHQPARTYPSGAPAIHPRNAVSGAPTPGYTADDVRHYLAARPPFSTADGQPPTIDTILFTQASRARALLRGASVGRPDEALVCLVVLRGALIPRDEDEGMVRPPRDGLWKVRPAPIGVIVFDAHTGNLLVRGRQPSIGERRPLAPRP